MSDSPKVDIYIRNRDATIREQSKHTSIADLAETYELSETEIQAILDSKPVKTKRKFLNLEKASSKSLDKMLEKIKAMRLKGFSKIYISSEICLRVPDVIAIIDEFKIPYGFRCEDCDCQVILDKVIGSKRLCPACAKVRNKDSTVRYIRNRYRTDPVFREKMKKNARNYRKQTKILG